MQGIFVVHISNGEKNPESENREHLMLREIEEEVERLERISAEITMRHAVLSQLRNSIREILELSGKPDKTGTQAGPKTSPTVENEPPTGTDTSTPLPEPETPNLTENEQLEMLERGLRYAVSVLENTKMAYYFKTIKQLREDLATLVKNGNASVPERIAKLKDRLSHAVKVLSESTRAIKSKVTSALRKYLAGLLENIA